MSGCVVRVTASGYRGRVALTCHIHGLLVQLGKSPSVEVVAQAAGAHTEMLADTG